MAANLTCDDNLQDKTLAELLVLAAAKVVVNGEDTAALRIAFEPIGTNDDFFDCDNPAVDPSTMWRTYFGKDVDGKVCLILTQTTTV